MRFADDVGLGESGAGITLLTKPGAVDDVLRIQVEGEASPRVTIGADGVSGPGLRAAPFGNGVDDTATLQSFINSVPTGSMVLFPTTTYLLSSPLLLKERVMYVGPMTHIGVTFRQVAGADMALPLLCSANWFNNVGASNGIWIERLNIDGNKGANAGSTIDCHGILICGWESTIKDCHLIDTPGSGIVLADASRNGVSVPGTCVENRVTGNRIQTPNGHGIFGWEQGAGNKVTDGFCVDNIINSAKLNGIYLMRGAGWLVSGNHSYSSANLGEFGIRIDNAFDTRVVDNYIDNYGQSNVGGAQFWSGIRVDLSSGGGAIPVGSVVANNTIRCSEDNVGGAITYRHLYVICKSTLTSSAAVTGNVVNGNNTAAGIGIRCEAAAGATFDVACSGNQVSFVLTAANRFQFVKTGTAISGQIDCYGVGTPEAVITAPIGSTYRRTDGGAGTSLYVKETGTGNAGWVGK